MCSLLVSSTLLSSSSCFCLDLHYSLPSHTNCMRHWHAPHTAHLQGTNRTTKPTKKTKGSPCASVFTYQNLLWRTKISKLPWLEAWKSNRRSWYSTILLGALTDLDAQKLLGKTQLQQKMTRNLRCLPIIVSVSAPLTHQSHWHKTCHGMLSNFISIKLSPSKIWKLQVAYCMFHGKKSLPVLSRIYGSHKPTTPWNFPPTNPWEPGTWSILLSCEAISKQQAMSPRKSDLRSNWIQRVKHVHFN